MALLRKTLFSELHWIDETILHTHALKFINLDDSRSGRPWHRRALTTSGVRQLTKEPLIIQTRRMADLVLYRRRTADLVLLHCFVKHIRTRAASHIWF
jgi:hypothetical protein